MASSKGRPRAKPVKKGLFQTCPALKVCRIVPFHLQLYRITFVELNGKNAEEQEIFKKPDQ